MRILMLVLQYPPDINATGQIYAQLAEEIVDRGHDVRVITTFPHYQNFRVLKPYRGKVFERTVQGGVRVKRVWSFANGRKSMKNRLLNYLSFNLLALFVGLTSRKPVDVILAPNGSFFIGMTSWLIGIVRRAPYVYNVQDLYPDVPIKMGQIRNPSAVRVLRWMERFMYKRACAVTVIAPSFKKVVTDRGLHPEKAIVIPNFVDTREVRPLSRQNDFAVAHQLMDRFVVCYSGNLGYSYDLALVLSAAQRLRDYPEILFLIIGDGVEKGSLVRRSEELLLENVKFLPFQPESEKNLIRASSEVQLCPYAPGASASSMPSKVLEIMASGKPIVAAADKGSDLENILQRSGAGICVEAADIDGFANALRRLFHGKEVRTAMGTAGRRFVEQEYSLERVADAYEQLLLGKTSRSR